MSGGSGTNGPNAELTRIVVDALVAQSLLDPKRAPELEQKILSGKMRQDDWVQFVGLEVWNPQGGES